MFEEISYKKKFFAVLVLFAMLSFTAYKRSFRNAIEAVSFYSESKKSISQNSNAHLELIQLKTELARLDNIIGKKAKNPGAVQNQILSFLSNQDRNIKLSKINPVHIVEDPYFNIYSNLITIEGSSNNILNTVYSFEKDFEYARIANLKLFVIKNSRTAKKELYTNIIFQNYERKN